MSRGIVMKRMRIVFISLFLACLVALNAQANVLSERTYKRLTVIHELMGEEKYDEALAKLAKLLPSVKHSPGEKALVLQTYAYVYASKEQYAKAVDYFKQALALNALPEAGVQSVRYNLAQVCMASEDYRCSIEQLKLWLAKAEKPAPDAYALLGTAYAQLGQYDAAIPHLKTAVEKAEKPKETWYQLLLAMYYEKKDYRNSARLLEKMVVLFPDKKDYWMQLSGVYFNLKNDIKSLAVMELAYKRGMLTSSKELVNLANMYLFQAIPYEGAEVLQKGLEEGRIETTRKNWELTSNAWMQAKEYDKAVVALTKAAALSEDGELYVNIAMLHAEREDWKALIEAVDKAEKKGIKKSPGKVKILKGIAYYNLNQPKQALASFEKARHYDKTRTEADQWIEHLSHESSMLTAN